MNEPDHIDLFSGIGGFAVASNWAGYTTKIFCEENTFCRRVLNKHWPDTPIIKDIRDFDGTKWKGCRLLTGGFPCQPFSILRAGERRGSEDNRYLWDEMFRVIKEARPSFVLAENVTGILTMEIDEILSDLESEGYETGTIILPACAVNAPHRRDRCWILAHANQQYAQGERLNDNKKRWKRPEKGSYRLRCRDNQWDTEPKLDRVDNGIPERVDRLKALGASVVPQIVYEILKFTK